MAMIVQPMPEPMIMMEPQPTIIQQVVQPQVVYQPQPQPVTVIQTAPPPVTVVQAGPTVVVQANLRDLPGRMRCMYCQQEILTVTRPINGALTWTIFGVLFVFLIWPCCLIPFCVDSCRDIEHTCPHCRNVVHVYKRM